MKDNNPNLEETFSDIERILNQLNLAVEEMSLLLKADPNGPEGTNR